MSARKIIVKVLGDDGTLKEVLSEKFYVKSDADGDVEVVNKVKRDAINHPSHYNSGKIETIDAIEDWGFGHGFNLGNAIKYISRANHKNDCIEDLKKALWYIEREIKRLEKENTPIQPITTTSVLGQNEECICVLDTALETLRQPVVDNHTDNSPIATLQDYDDNIKLSDVIKPRDAIGVGYQLPVLTLEDTNRINHWYKEHMDGECSCKGTGASGGRILFEVIPTFHGDIVSVKCSNCNEEFLLGGI